MKNIMSMLILLFCFFLAGCPAGFLDPDTLTLSLEKEEYAKDEDISFTVSGKYSEEDEVNFVCIRIWIEKYYEELEPFPYDEYDGVIIKSINNIDLENDTSNEFIVNGWLEYKKDGRIYFDQDRFGEFSYRYFLKDFYLTDVNEVVVFSLQNPEEGKYRVVTQVNLESDKYRYGTEDFLYYDFTVTE